MASGYLTAPVLYALEENSELANLIQREFSSEGDIEKALKFVRESKAITRSRKLAEDFAKDSYNSIKWLPESPFKQALLDLPDYVLSRLY